MTTEARKDPLEAKYQDS